MSSPLLIGVDLGTTQLKAGIFDLSGRMLSSASRRYATARPAADLVEQEPQDWWTALQEVVAKIAAQVPSGEVAGLGICSQVNTHVFVDERGRALRPALSWQDQRCASVATELSAAAALHIDASNLLARAEWVRRSEPALWEQTRWILSPKDYLNLRLTGRAATDGLSSIGLVEQAGTHYLSLDAIVEGVQDVLPPLEDPAGAVGWTDGIALGLPAGIPVAVATMDAWGSVYGSGVTENAQGFEISGTSEILGLVGDHGPGHPGVVEFPPYRGLHLFAGPTQAGGDAIRWLSSVHEHAIPWALTHAERAAPGAEGLIFLPHLAGERAPLWDSHLRGAFVGLELGHDRSHMCRAVLEGVAFSARQLLDALEHAAGLRPTQLALSGGAAASELWSQIKADVLGLPLGRLEVLDSGVFGAALFAGVAAGKLDDLEHAAQTLIRTEQVFEPRGENAAIHEESYAFYLDAQAALSSVLRRRSRRSVPR